MSNFKPCPGEIRDKLTDLFSVRRRGHRAIHCLFEPRLRDQLLQEGRFLITLTEFQGSHYLRLSLMNPDTDETVIEQLLERIEELVRG